MKTLLEQINNTVSDAFYHCQYDRVYGKTGISNRPDLCEFQCNGAMAAAKIYKKRPMDIAEEVAKKLEGEKIFESIEAVMPGFINIKVSNSFLLNQIKAMAKNKKFGLELPEKQKIIVDFGGANVAKPLHIGHLRSAIIGESIKRIGLFMGHEVIGDVHLGDWGLQMGLIIEELKERQPNLCYFDPDFTGEYPEEAPFTIAELEEIYPTASKKSKEDPEFKEKAQQATLKLQSGYAPYRAIWKHILAISKVDLKKNYDNLDVSFDLWKGESDAQPYIPTMIEDMENRQIAYESEGALVVDIAEEGDSKELPPCIIRKSDGAALYATSDLATLVEREKLYQPDAYIYVADKRQDLHYTQFFRVAKKAGIVPKDRKLTFIGFGTMNGKDGKPFKTRAGGVMRLEDLIKEVEDAVYTKILDNRDINEVEAREIAKLVGQAAIKYGDLSNQAGKDYIFDIDRFVSFEGNTGPYILYTIVRIKSILAKYANQSTTETISPEDLREANQESEKKLELELARFSEVIKSAWEEQAPHKICQYVYAIANAFNTFYHEVKILSEEDIEKKKSYLALILLTQDVLVSSIYLLGMKAPERM